MREKTSLLLIVLCALISNNSVFAENGSCKKTAVTAVEKKFNKYFFNHNHRIRQVDSIECKKMISKKGVAYKACEVSASNGEGAGDVTFGVLQSYDCKLAFQAFVIGEE